MLIHPQFDPVAVHIGPVSLHWYGLMYLIGFALFIALGRIRIKQHPDCGWTNQELDDFLTWVVAGVILGGRLGEVLFYQPAYYWQHPGEILAIWQGGMSFHGGLIGVLLAVALFARKKGITFLQAGDFVAPLAPTGLAAGRIGNFINGELWGRVASPDLPWAMVFPKVDALPRHPSQLYQAGLEGLALFVILWLFARKPRPTGQVSAVFLMGYGSFRFIAEYFRTPDAGIFGQSDIISMGQWLSTPMIAAGIGLWVWSIQKKTA
ncbi:phosphatidylglycerol:prolipoprotein diacylglycerol transferase [Formivibrio citricus]|uniref:Phosphatidylglycerol--prolipoprotein diacylglyceryl transferase n=1 Tax=Formivibrio citricus TaxID=83765 RepID=A0A1I5D1B7_9NEIS|nr:prolipoprotein diacylglyceryl transferase [Formivibrio citricus]SFN92671.1 phosphatidylglycerol:prolipoprotein diacylglycerol transferase [Formivibrio citricus]